MDLIEREMEKTKDGSIYFILLSEFYTLLFLANHQIYESGTMSDLLKRELRDIFGDVDRTKIMTTSSELINCRILVFQTFNLPISRAGFEPRSSTPYHKTSIIYVGIWPINNKTHRSRHKLTNK